MEKIVFLSNAPRPSSKVIDFLLNMKMNIKYLSNVMTSGEAAMHAINKNKFGKTFFHLGPQRDNSIFEQVKDNQVSIDSCDYWRVLSIEQLTGLFAISGYSGKASGRFLAAFGGDFPVVFYQFGGRNIRKK